MSTVKGFDLIIATILIGIVAIARSASRRAALPNRLRGVA